MSFVKPAADISAPLKPGWGGEPSGFYRNSIPHLALRMRSRKLHEESS
jgi:hypothetical protein